MYRIENKAASAKKRKKHKTDKTELKTTRTVTH